MARFNEQPKNMSMASAKSARWRNNPYYKFHKNRKKSREEINEAVEKSLDDFVPTGTQEDLCREIWDENDQLIPEVRKQLKKIAIKFIESIDLKAPIKDIIFTGSLANYNWTKTSDIDLHIVIDFDDVDENTEFVRDYFDIQKALWGLKHDINVKGHEVEIYVQNQEEEHHSSGVYSIRDGEWIEKPDKKKVEVDKDSIRKKAQAIADMINALPGIKDDEEREEEAESIKEKIRKMRKTGLSSAGEYSVENLAFKTLRNGGYLEKLSDAKINAFDQALSLDEGEVSKFSLIQVEREGDGKVDGYWLHDHIGNLETAKKEAKANEAANGNRIDVAVVPAVNTTTPLLHGIFKGLKRLDNKELEEETGVIKEKAKSKAQQRFFGIVKALQLGEIPPSKASKKARKAAKDMSKKDVDDFASTKHKGIPEKVEEDKIKGGLADGMTPEDLAKKHGVDVWQIIQQIHKGVTVEKEHTGDEEAAKDIAMDHLFEDPKYYDKLADMESSNQEKSGGHKYEYGCLMTFFDIPTWEDKILAKIDQEDLYEEEEGYGLEHEPHTTVLFGFHDDEVDYEDVIQEVRESCSKPLRVEIKGASCFENEKFDVLKFDVDGEDLHRLNGVMRESFPYTNDYPDYHPHMTIAYLKPGMGKKYVSKFKNSLVLEGEEMVYSMPGKKKIHWSLNPDFTVDRMVKYDSDNGENKLYFHKGENMSPEKMELIRDFVEFVCLKIEMEHPVTVHFRDGRDEYIKTTASYVPSENSNHINCKGRSLVDICRSIAHELTHNRQLEIGKFKIGEAVQNIGGEIENEADSVAGMLIKDFTHNNGYDEIYDY